MKQDDFLLDEEELDLCDVITDSPDKVFEGDRRLRDFLPANSIEPLRQIVYEPEM